jgi:hypothetical protein
MDTNDSAESYNVIFTQEPFDSAGYLEKLSNEIFLAGERTRSPYQEFDFYNVLGSGLKALGSALESAAKIAQTAEQKSYVERFNNAFHKLVDLDNRINDLPLAEAVASEAGVNEAGVNENQELQSPGTPKPQLRNRPQKGMPPSQTIDSQFNKTLQQFDQKLDALESAAGVNNDRQLIRIDANLPLVQKLELIEQAINILTDRVEKLEQFFSRQQVEEAEEDTTIAKTLITFAVARSQHLNENAAGVFPTTIGTVEIRAPKEDTVIISIQDEDNDEPKFSAICINDEWTVDRNDLTKADKQRIFEWPQELKAHQITSATKAFISELKQSYPEDFNKDESAVMWALTLPQGLPGYTEGQEIGRYRMSTRLNDDQSRDLILEEQLLDQDRNPSEIKTVLSVKINSDESIDVKQCDLTFDGLKSQRNALQTTRLQPERDQQQQQEL